MIFQLIKSIFDNIIDIVYPPVCIGCFEYMKRNRKYKWFCSKECKEKFRYSDEFRSKCDKCGKIIEHSGTCPMCNQEKIYYDMGETVFEYDGAVKNAIIKYKFSGLYSLGEYFADTMSDYIKENLDVKDYDIITCVPLYKLRKRQRGYNQSEILAKRIGKNIDLTFRNTLKKVVNTKVQSTLSAKERAVNIKNAFECCSDVKGKKVLIVDDILTTGNTINECCRVLKKEGAVKVDFITLAGVYDK